jgi:predicted DNA-binding helix-hairpin-helix protein
MTSVQKILLARKFRKLNWEHLKKIGIAMNRAQYFLVCDSLHFERKDLQPQQLKSLILKNSTSKYDKILSPQLNLFS